MTSISRTIFYFAINASTDHKDGNGPLFEALERFADSLQRPNFDTEAAEQQRTLIRSEFAEQKQTDAWKVHQVEESLSNRAHPLSWNFTCGDQKMLENPPEVEAEKSHQFFKDHYGADEMKMVFVAPLPLSVMQVKIAKVFGSMRQRASLKPDWGSIPMWTDRQRGWQVFVRSTNDIRQIRLQFKVPDDKKNVYREGYVLSLVQQWGPGSIYAQLKSQDLASHVRAYLEEGLAGSKRLTVCVTATEKGLDQLRDIVVCVLQFLAILSKEGPQREYVEEKMKKAANDFEFGEKEDELEFAVGVCTSMFLDHERSSLLSSISNISGFDPEAILVSWLSFTPTTCD
jgi:insulysin